MGNNFELIASTKATDHLNSIKKAEILVGMPSYNNVFTANFVVSQIIGGLEKFFPNYKSVIFISDGGSADGTLTSIKQMNLKSQNIKLIPTIYVGASGKGSAIQAIFEAARYLEVKSVALVDSDLRSVTPDWMRLLLTPIMTGTDFVTPFYNRAKYDGTITNFLCYPLTTALFGKEIRQPIGGDFGLSIRLVEKILDSPIWGYPYVSRFGIDIFETFTALAQDFTVKEAYLGIKEHDPKDPSSQLIGMFRQVVGTMFTCIEKYEAVWKRITGFDQVEKFGEAKYDPVPDVKVSLSNTIAAFKSNYDNFTPIYRSFLSKEIQSKFEQLKTIESSNVELPSEIWVTTVYEFIKQFHKEKDQRGQLLLLDALRILWIGKVACFIKDTWDLDRSQAENKIKDEVKVFVKLKPYLIETY